MKHFVVYAIKDACHTLDEVNGITTNSSEGFNFLIKDFQEWKEATLDTIAMSFKILQGYYLEETRRGKYGIGKYVLCEKFKGIMSDVMEFPQRKLVCHPKDIDGTMPTKTQNNPKYFVPYRTVPFRSGF